MSINIIAALSKNRVIGLNGRIPWNLPKDLKYFKDVTTGKYVITNKGKNALLMGSKTWQSLPTYPEPLKERGSYVVTKKNAFCTRSSLSYPRMPDYDDIKRIQKIYPNVWICGGESIYNHFIEKPYIDKLYLTEIDADIEGDTFFPEIPDYFFKTIQGETHTFKHDALNYVNYNFCVYSNCGLTKSRMYTENLKIESNII